MSCEPHLDRFLTPELRAMEDSGDSVEGNLPGDPQLPLDQIPHLVLSGIRIFILLI